MDHPVHNICQVFSPFCIEGKGVKKCKLQNALSHYVIPVVWFFGGGIRVGVYYGSCPPAINQLQDQDNSLDQSSYQINDLLEIKYCTNENYRYFYIIIVIRKRIDSRIALTLGMEDGIS